MQVSINVICDCGAKMIITPPKCLQEMNERSQNFDIHCCYCQGKIGDFKFTLRR